MTIQAQIEGGPTLEFEDGTPPDVIQRVVQQHTQAARQQPAAGPAMQFGQGIGMSALGQTPSGQPVPPNPAEALTRAVGPTASDVIQSIPTALVHAGTSMLGTPGALMQGVRGAARVLYDPLAHALRGDPSPQEQAALDQWTRTGATPEQWGSQLSDPSLRALATGNPPTPSDLNQSVQNAGIPLHTPTTPAGGYAHDVTEGAASMALGPIRALPWMIGLGAAAGGAGRAMEDLTSTMDPNSLARRYGPEVARLVTTLVGGIPAARRGAVGQALEERMAGITPADTQRAADLAAEGRRMGVPLSPAEAYGPAGTQLQNLASDITASPQGAALATALQGRQPQVINAVRGPGGILERISPDVSTEAPMAARSAAASPLYSQAAMETIDPAGLGAENVLSGTVPQVRQAIREAGASNPLGRQLSAYERSLVTPEAGESVMRVGPLQTAYQNMRDNILPDAAAMTESDRAALAARLQGAAGGPNAALAQTLENISPTFRQAQDAFRNLSPRVEAAQTRQNLLDTLDQALNAGTVAPRNPTVGARFANLARGREGATTRETFDESVRQAALARGLNPDTLVADLNRSMDVLAETGSIPGVGSRTGPRGQLGAEMRTSPMASVLQAPQTVVGRGPIIDWLLGRAERSNYGQLGNMLMPGADVNALNAARGAGVGPRQAALAARLLAVLQAPGQIEQGH